MKARVALLVLAVVMAVVAVVGAWLGQRMLATAHGVEFLKPREFSGLTAVFVGTGGTYENPRRRGPAVAIGVGRDVVLVDAGRAVAEGLRAVHIPVDQPRAVYLTSLLPEDTVGLDDLLLTGWLAPRETPLRVVGPPGTAALVRGLEAAHRIGIEGEQSAFGLPPQGARFEAVEVRDGAVLEEGSLHVRVADLPGGPVPSRAYRFEAGGASAVVGGAAWGGDALVALARGAGLLVQEAHFADAVEMAIRAGAQHPERMRREARWRTPLRDAGRRAARAGVGELALVRLRPPPLLDFQATRLAGEYFHGTIVVPDDGEEIAVKPGSPRPAAPGAAPAGAADGSGRAAARGDRPEPAPR